MERGRVDEAVQERVCHGAYGGAGPVLASLAMLARKSALRVTGGGCVPPLPAVARRGMAASGRDGKAGLAVEPEGRGFVSPKAAYLAQSGRQRLTS